MPQASAEPVTVGKGTYSYTWDSNWAKLPDGVETGNCHGVAVSKDGRVHVFNQSKHALLSFAPDGSIDTIWDQFPSDRFLGAHGLTLVEENGDEFLWLTDQHTGEVVKVTLDGKDVMSLDKPASYDQGDGYSPTWAAQAPDGRVYVGDGYGSSRISVYDANGKFVETWSETPLGRFGCPHGLLIATRKAATGVEEPVLYVTDRSNSRVQVLTVEGTFVKAFYQDHPCSFAIGPNDELMVPDLYAFVNIYDKADQPIMQRLGDHQHQVARTKGWPNVDASLIHDGKFNSPHGSCFDADGNIYVVEWIPQGRITKLTKQ